MWRREGAPAREITKNVMFWVAKESRNKVHKNKKRNKLAKARKTRKSPGTLGLKNFGPGKLWDKKVWARNIFIDFLAELDNFKIFFLFFFSRKIQIFKNLSIFKFQKYKNSELSAAGAKQGVRSLPMKTLPSR